MAKGSTSFPVSRRNILVFSAHRSMDALVLCVGIFLSMALFSCSALAYSLQERQSNLFGKIRITGQPRETLNICVVDVFEEGQERTQSAAQYGFADKAISAAKTWTNLIQGKGVVHPDVVAHSGSLIIGKQDDGLFYRRDPQGCLSDRTQQDIVVILDWHEVYTKFWREKGYGSGSRTFADRLSPMIVVNGEDLAEKRGQFDEVILHEMGHVFGFDDVYADCKNHDPDGKPFMKIFTVGGKDFSHWRSVMSGEAAPTKDDEVGAYARWWSALPVGSLRIAWFRDNISATAVNYVGYGAGGDNPEYNPDTDLRLRYDKTGKLRDPVEYGCVSSEPSTPGKGGRRGGEE
jgi:hypothetical protein